MLVLHRRGVAAGLDPVEGGEHCPTCSAPWALESSRQGCSPPQVLIMAYCNSSSNAVAAAACGRSSGGLVQLACAQLLQLLLAHPHLIMPALVPGRLIPLR